MTFVDLVLTVVLTRCFRQDVWSKDNPCQIQRRVSATPCETTNECIHGVGARGTTQDPQGLSRYAQLEHQQDSRYVIA